MKTSFAFKSTLIFATLLLAAACTSHNKAHTALMAADSIRIAPLSTDKPSANPAVATRTTSIAATMKLNKAAILGQEFIYGLDLQYSSQYDKDEDLYNQSLVAGHWPATFVINGDELQLVAETSDQYPSDVNHPAQLISRYTIISQDDTTLTVAAAKSAPFIALQLLSDPKADPKPSIDVLDTWMRSFAYVPAGDYILQESSVEMADGTIFEVMESVFPRQTIAAGTSFKKFKMSADSDSGAAADSPAEVSRFRFLPGSTVYTGEDKHAWSQHFDLSPKADGSPATIDWYATANIPDEDLAPVKEAVEGWNRYFRTYEGFKRDVVLFKGRLPDGIHLGDPRYNVINWDSRQIAGAAYESQGSDPDTGVQSHSLIYMPAAWLKIGSDYWTAGFASQTPGSDDTKARVRTRGQTRLSCARQLDDAAQIIASGRLPADQAKVFGIQILKQTLFHEVGHALGLAHNFKGSLSWDANKPGSMFSTSIMDYNDYEIERAAFDGVASANGPLLEYDRQAISAIYDNGKAVSSSDAKVPTCNDAEADTEASGVDPFCIRYDNESDPTQSVARAQSRITSATLAGDVSVAQALAAVPDLALVDSRVSTIKTADDLKAAAAAVANELKGSLAFYIVSGKMSLDYVTRLNIKSLLQFEDGVLPAGTDERAMRERAFSGVLASVNLLSLPDSVKVAESAAIAATLTKLQSSPAMQALTADQLASTQKTLSDSMSAVVASFESDANVGLPKLRMAVLTSMKRHDAVSFYLGSVGGAQLDYETAIVGLLSEIVAAPNAARTTDERVLAATVLASYKGRFSGTQAIAMLQSPLLSERAQANSNDERDTVEQVLKALSIGQ